MIVYFTLKALYKLLICNTNTLLIQHRSNLHFPIWKPLYNTIQNTTQLKIFVAFVYGVPTVDKASAGIECLMMEGYGHIWMVGLLLSKGNAPIRVGGLGLDSYLKLFNYIRMV